jgi:DNA-binding transcriptional MerR regulator
MAARKTKLVGIDEAARLFGKSVHQMRQYKSKGLLKVADCEGNKDLFDMAEIILLKHLIHEMRVTEGLSLAQISKRLDQMMGRGRTQARAA